MQGLKRDQEGESLALNCFFGALGMPGTQYLT